MEISNEKANIKNQINIQNNYAPINLGDGEKEEKAKNTTIDKVTLKEMIGDNELKEVLDILVETFPKKNEFLLQKSRLKSITKDNRIGVISSSDFRVEQARIVYAVLDMIDEL